MKTSEVIELADTLSDSILDNDQWVALINLCLDDLTPVAKNLKTRAGLEVEFIDGKGTVDIAGDEDIAKAYEIKTFYIDGRPLRPLPNYDRLAKGWKDADGSILIQGMGTAESGTADIDYYERLPHVQIPDEVEGTDDDIPLPDEYCSLVITFIAAKSQQAEEEIQDEQNFWQLYLQGKQQFALDRIWKMEPENRKYIREMRVQVQASSGK